jgi:hypothetical protein
MPVEPPRRTEMDRTVGLRAMLRQKSERLQNLKLQVSEKAAEVDDLRNELDRLRQRLFEEADVFSRERESRDLMRALQDSYDGMFTPRADPLAAEFELTVRENEHMKRQIARIKCEIRSAKQITMRLAFATTRKFV